jgi:adenine-specific DNA methylase
MSRCPVIETGFANCPEWPPAPLSADVRVVQGSSEQIVMPDKSVDIVLTDPPYHDDVHYDELSLLLRAWARLPAGNAAVAKDRTGRNVPLGDYRGLLTRIFAEARRILRPEGHLVFSYANREPRAWVDVLRAIEQAGLRAVGYTTVHSENETDYAKRGVGACTMNIILDLVPLGDTAVEQWSPTAPPSGPEDDFLRTVGDTFLQLSELRDGWEPALVDILRASHFLSPRKSTTSCDC